MGTINHYTHVPGFFVQDQTNETDDAVPPRFGLLDKSADRWPKFWQEIDKLNSELRSAQGLEYKVVFLGRHGLSIHNVAMQKYPGDSRDPSKENWYTYWGNRYTDGVLTWGPDPSLAHTGFNEATFVHSVWVKELQAGIGLPQTIYCSPLTRTLYTHTLTFSGLDGYRPQDSVVVENCRELCLASTPEQRRSKSYIQETFPPFTIEPDFKEHDPIWNPVFPETDTDIENRIRTVLDKAFSRDGPFVSITSHGYYAKEFCRVIGHPVFNLKPGGVVPLVICKSLVASLPRPPIQPGTYTICSVSNPDHIMCLPNVPQSIIPTDSVIAGESMWNTFYWDVSPASKDRYYIRPHERQAGPIHSSIKMSPRGDYVVSIDDSDDEPEYNIKSDGMDCYRIVIPSSHLAYTFTGHQKSVRLAPQIVDNDAQRWHFDRVLHLDIVLD